jgi:hypothetical protein
VSHKLDMQMKLNCTARNGVTLKVREVTCDVLLNESLTAVSDSNVISESIISVSPS